MGAERVLCNNVKCIYCGPLAPQERPGEYRWGVCNAEVIHEPGCYECGLHTRCITFEERDEANKL